MQCHHRQIEVDPRVTTGEHLQGLRDVGFNRLSVGIQDFDPQVQAAIHRVPPNQVRAALSMVFVTA